MFTYQQWDAIADTYIPFLALLCSIQLVMYFLSGTELLKAFILVYLKSSMLRLLCILTCVVWVYAIMFIDAHFKIWPSINISANPLDYSTHTALALVFGCYLYCATINSQRLLAYGTAASMVLYLLLMKYQNYHTFADMLTTMLVVLPPVYLILKKVTSMTNKTI